MIVFATQALAVDLGTTVLTVVCIVILLAVVGMIITKPHVNHERKYPTDLTKDDTQQMKAIRRGGTAACDCCGKQTSVEALIAYGSMGAMSMCSKCWLKEKYK